MESKSTQSDQPKPESRRDRYRRDRQSTGFGRLCRVLLRVLLLLLIGFAGLLYFAYQSAQKAPKFYQELLEQPLAELEVAGDDFETKVVDLQNSAREEGTWKMVFTEDQINGWLASDLPAKFPRALPKNVTNPRFKFEPNDIKMACRLTNERLKGIVVTSLDAFCTDQPNEIAIRIKSVQSGFVPIPVSQWADRITLGLRKEGLEVTWMEIEGDSVALIKVPEDKFKIGEKRVTLESIESHDGNIALTGRTTPVEPRRHDSESPE